MAYGYVNGKAVQSRDEFIFETRHLGPIESDEELIAYAEKITCGWSPAGWKHKFTDFYLSDYALSLPYSMLTITEFIRLKGLQKEAIAEERRIEEEKKWRFIERFSYADNSIEDVYEDKDGNRKTVMVVGPHGDCC